MLASAPIVLTGNLVYAQRWDDEDDCADGFCVDIATDISLCDVPALVRAATADLVRDNWPEGRFYFTGASGRRSLDLALCN